MKRKVVKELIEQIEEEIEKSTDTKYVTIEGDVITADVGCITDWMEEYKKILEKRYEFYDFEFDQATLIAAQALKEVQQYREIGTGEELKNSTREEDILKFYYCESEDDYYIGKRVGNFYYARYGKTGFTWFMSRYLPWGEHVIAPNTLWKEHTYPSEPKEIPFFEWLQGFMKKYYGGTAEECREAVEKQKAKKCVEESCPDHTHYKCPSCGKIQKTKYGDSEFGCILNYCSNCGQALDENLEEMEDE